MMKYIHNVFFSINFKKIDEIKLQKKSSSLREVVGVEHLYFGRNVTPEKEKMCGYNYGLTIIFDSYESLGKYATDPLHMQFKQYIKDATCSVIVNDFPVD